MCYLQVTGSRHLDTENLGQPIIVRARHGLVTISCCVQISEREANVIAELMCMAPPGLSIYVTVLPACQVMGGQGRMAHMVPSYCETPWCWNCKLSGQMWVTLNLVSTSLRNRAQPLQIAAVRIWTYFLQVLNRRTPSVGQPINMYPDGLSRAHIPSWQWAG